MYQPAMKARMSELEQQKAEIEKRLAEAPADLPDVHPNIAEHYRAKVIRLAETLVEPESNGEAREDIRSLIGEVVITPGEKRGESHATLRGELMAILDLAASDTLPIVAMISLMALAVSVVEFCVPATCAPISSVAFAVCEASAFTSCATTAKPLPASPARAASIVALSASRLVCAATDEISCTTSPIRVAAAVRSVSRASAFLTCVTASFAIWLDRSTCLAMVPTE